MKVSDYIVQFLKEKKIKVIFGYIGGAITHLVDSIDKVEGVEYIQTYNEQTAAFAAEGYSRANKTLGVAIATSGPGATNLISGIADSFCDNIPVLYITGQVNTYEGKGQKPIRQQGFQELEIISVVQSITKYAKYIDSPDSVPYELEKAFQIANQGRKGPVLLDIPMDIQRSEIDIECCGKYEKKYENRTLKISEDSIFQINKLIKNSKNPIILLGGGVEFLSREQKKKMQNILSLSKIPVVCSLMGKGKVDESKVNFIGMIGSYGNRSANRSIKYCDLLIAIGSRLDTRQTGAKISNFLENGKIIHIDIDQNELKSHRIKNKVDVAVDVNIFTSILSKILSDFSVKEEWINKIEAILEKYNQNEEIDKHIEIKSPYVFFQQLNNYTKAYDTFVVDIGQNQMWASQTLEIKDKQNFYTGGGLACMGYSLPFSIGLAFGGKKRIISISGDGGFHMSIQSLMLISQYRLPIKIIIMNNKRLGMITQFQGLYFNNNLVGTTKEKGYEVPNIKDLAKAYHLKYYILKEDDLNNRNMQIIFRNSSPCIVEYIIDDLTTVSPKLEFDSPIYDPTPKINYEI